MYHKFLSLLIIFFLAEAIAASQSSIKTNECVGDSEYALHPGPSFITPRLTRFYQLGDLAEQAYQKRQYKSAQHLANEYLDLAELYPCNWNYGNAIHDGYRILGLVSLRRGDLDRAAWFLLDASKSKGSMQLNTFGPNLDLANRLLRQGRDKEVLAYLEQVQHFWQFHEGTLPRWIDEIKRGKSPRLVKATDSEYHRFYTSR